MKIILLPAATLVLLSACSIFKGKQKAATPPLAAVNTDSILYNLSDSAGYALGINIGTSLKMQSMTEISTKQITRAIGDVLAGKPTLLDDNAAFTVLSTYSNRMQLEKSQAVIKTGEDSLQRNKLRPTVKVTPSGLQYEVIKEGNGIHPTPLDTFVANFRGMLVDGSTFQESFTRNEPLVYPVGQMIKGWIEGLQLMSVGSRYIFWVPYELGYGVQGNPPVIPGGSMLIFELELLDVKKHP